jgi:hypothetical protein
MKSDINVIIKCLPVKLSRLVFTERLAMAVIPVSTVLLLSPNTKEVFPVQFVASLASLRLSDGQLLGL